MLLDHIGAVFGQGYFLRIIGRLSFPIYCFLLAEGAAHTRHPGKYALRLTLVTLLAEIPYDLLFYGGIHWGHQNVMVTLLCGLGTLLALRRWPKAAVVTVVLGCILAELAKGSYGGWGVALIVLFGWTARHPRADFLQPVGMGLIFLGMGGASLPVSGIPVQIFGLGALFPIRWYHGEKSIDSKALQWSFYLFYPVHLLVLLGIMTGIS